MTYTGTVRNGVVVFDNGQPPEGARVAVAIVDASSQPNAPETSVGARMLEWAGIIDDLPEDIARNHDHYLHGHESDEADLRRHVLLPCAAERP